MPIRQSSGRASPPTERVVAVLDFLARHPHDRFGVSELARRVGLSKPTCLGIVTTLTDSDYLVRDSKDKTYRLGPALISLGHTAQESLRVDPAARAELRRLSTISGTTAALSAVIDDRITVLELVGPPGADVGVRVGQSYPFAPPVGLMFVLWDDVALRDWLAKEPTIPLRTDGERSQNPPGGRQRHDISVISAPVFDHHQRQAMVVSLQIGRAITDTEIAKRARALKATADVLTSRLGGTKPAFDL